ncbi:hypothetical protein LAV76_15530 [Bacillus paramobilis]|uniref:hypothetical protein n=1 Tax=Bacillus paramobilis TaxID=2817477 RepID=UPI0030C981D3
MAKYSAKVIAGEFMKENTQFNAFVSNNTMNLKTFNPANSIDKNIDPERWRLYIRKVDLIDESRSKDTFKIAGRTILGSALLGTPGAIIGAASTKEDVICNILVTYKDGKRDLIECTEHIYKLLKQEQFKNALVKDDVELENPRNKPDFLASATPYLSKLERERNKQIKEDMKNFDKKLRIAIYTCIFLCGIGFYLLIA